MGRGSLLADVVRLLGRLHYPPVAPPENAVGHTLARKCGVKVSVRGTSQHDGAW